MKLNDEQMQVFIKKFFKSWDKDIKEVYYIIYCDKIEFLINRNYIFTVKKATNL